MEQNLHLYHHHTNPHALVETMPREMVLLQTVYLVLWSYVSGLFCQGRISHRGLVTPLGYDVLHHRCLGRGSSKVRGVSTMTIFMMDLFLEHVLQEGGATKFCFCILSLSLTNLLLCFVFFIFIRPHKLLM